MVSKLSNSEAKKRGKASGAALKEKNAQKAEANDKKAKSGSSQQKRTTRRATTAMTNAPRASRPSKAKADSKYSLEFLQGAIEKADRLDEGVDVLGGKIDKLSDTLEGVSQKVSLNRKMLIFQKRNDTVDGGVDLEDQAALREEVAALRKEVAALRKEISFLRYLLAIVSFVAIVALCLSVVAVKRVPSG